MNGLLAAPVAKGLVDASYLLTAFLFIMGLKRMSSPVTAKSGIVWAGWGMLVATLVTFIDPQITANYVLDRHGDLSAVAHSRGGPASALP